MDSELVTLLRTADAAASVAHDFIYGRNAVTQRQASDAIWAIHNTLRPLLSGQPSLIQPRRTYSHYHACDGELRLDCEACIEEWIADIEAGGATRESAVATVDRAIQEGGRVWWCS